jgi:hypothetical protein
MPGAGLPEQGHDDPEPVLGVTPLSGGSESRRERRKRCLTRHLGGTLAREDRSPPVTYEPRSRVRREDVGDSSAAEGGGAHRLDGERCVEESLARAQDDRVDDKAVLVDQAGLDQRSSGSNGSGHNVSYLWATHSSKTDTATRRSMTRVASKRRASSRRPVELSRAPAPTRPWNRAGSRDRPHPSSRRHGQPTQECRSVSARRASGTAFCVKVMDLRGDREREKRR